MGSRVCRSSFLILIVPHGSTPQVTRLIGACLACRDRRKLSPNMAKLVEVAQNWPKPPKSRSTPTRIEPNLLEHAPNFATVARISSRMSQNVIKHSQHVVEAAHNWQRPSTFDRNTPEFGRTPARFSRPRAEFCRTRAWYRQPKRVEKCRSEPARNDVKLER